MRGQGAARFASALAKPRSRRPGSGHLAHHVVTAKRVGLAQRALRIFPPLAIHDKEVVMRPWGEVDRRRPNTTPFVLHRYGSLLPIRKITDQQNLLGVWFSD